MADGEDSGKLNQSVRKAILLLRATAADRGASVSSLARSVGLPRATALRMIQTLEQEDFLVRVPGDDRVLLGPGLLRLARGTDEQTLLREVARPAVQELVDAVRETATISVVGADGGLDLVAQIDAPHSLRPRSWLGQRFALHASASGKVLLAYDDAQLDRTLAEPLTRFTATTITEEVELRADLELVRWRRWAITRDEDEEGLTGIGAAVLGPSRDPVNGGGPELLGVVCVSGPTQRLDQQIETTVRQLLRTVGSIEAALHLDHDRDLEIVERTGS